MKKILFIVLLLSASITSQAQMGWEVGGWVGVSNYFGDLNTSFNVKSPGPAGGIIARYNFNNRLCLRFGANYGNVGADDANSKNTFENRRNLSFNSHIIEGLAQFEFNFLPYVHGSRDNFFTPYLFSGFSVFHFSPRTKFNGEWVALQPLGTEGQFKNDEYSLTQLSLVYGVGMKWDLTADWSMNFEISSRFLFTDYLDDVSDVYPEIDDLEALRGETAVMLSDRSIPDIEGIQIGEAGRQRGDSSNNDFFSYVGIGVVYYFGSIRCPKW
ncbi:MAG: hypothetical protein ACI94Y_000487 [Maribacter sp.]|jgi:hypothetical protein